MSDGVTRQAAGESTAVTRPAGDPGPRPPERTPREATPAGRPHFGSLWRVTPATKVAIDNQSGIWLTAATIVRLNRGIVSARAATPASAPPPASVEMTHRAVLEALSGLLLA